MWQLGFHPNLSGPESIRGKPLIEARRLKSRAESCIEVEPKRVSSLMRDKQQHNQACRSNKQQRNLLAYSLITPL
jgi:hypothetical protein